MPQHGTLVGKHAVELAPSPWLVGRTSNLGDHSVEEDKDKRHREKKTETHDLADPSQEEGREHTDFRTEREDDRNHRAECEAKDPRSSQGVVPDYRIDKCLDADQ
jgi:hypothetical protein